MDINFVENKNPKSKVTLAIIGLLGVSMCGVDRCYMGNVCLGVTKGLTLGGLLVWGIIDSVVIMINM